MITEELDSAFASPLMLRLTLPLKTGKGVVFIVCKIVGENVSKTNHTKISFPKQTSPNLQKTVTKDDSETVNNLTL